MQTATTRRTFLGQAAAGGLALPFAMPAFRHSTPQRKLEILFLGGTKFLGPHTVEAALARGHQVTLFNRGKTNPHLFPELEKLRGDRNKDLTALEGRKWDAVIDTSAYFPRQVREAAAVLKDNVDQYLFISTCSVYDRWNIEVADEDSSTGTLEDETVEKVTGETYGPLKALCEKTAETEMPGRVINVRPGLIVGPLDPSDRFTYWPVRVHRGGEVLAPDARRQGVQFIDARDLGEWCIYALENKSAGVYNALGFEGRVSFEECLHGCKITLNTECSFVWVGEEFLEEHQVGHWMEVPLWLPDDMRCWFSNRRAIEKGLRFRPISETIHDTLEWALKRPKDHRWRAGLKAEKERELLAEWHASRR